MCALYGNIVRSVRLFKYCEEGFIRSLVILLKPQVCLPGDWLIRQGEVSGVAQGIAICYKCSIKQSRRLMLVFCLCGNMLCIRT